jgi:hypothetical protein
MWRVSSSTALVFNSKAMRIISADKRQEVVENCKMKYFGKYY